MAGAADAAIREAQTRIVKNRIKIHGGTPPTALVLDVGDAIVLWQPDGEVKALRRKP